MSFIRIIEPGPLSTIQDKGRIGYQKYGMPMSGAMDLFSYRVANKLVGNWEGAAAIEFTLGGPAIEFMAEGKIAITGAEIAPFIDDRPVPLWHTLVVNKGSVLTFQKMKAGLRGYIAFAGDVIVPAVLNSRSTYLKGQIGGCNGRKLMRGDLLEIGNYHEKNPNQGYRLPNALLPSYGTTEEIRVVLGPQEQLFTKEGLRTFLTSPYQITNHSDRMGYRLKGPVVTHVDKADIISDGIPLGAIQVPGDGQPIIMMADRQTVGGYAKIATVISTDICTLAQMPPGSMISFKSVSLDEAYAAIEEQEKRINSIEEVETTSVNSRIFKLAIAGKNYIVGVEEV